MRSRGASRADPHRTTRDITITRIVQRAGVARCTFYRSFASEADVLGAYFERLVDDYTQHTAPVVAGSTHDIALAQFTFWAARLDFLKVLARNGLRHVLRNAYNAWIAEIAQRTGNPRAVEAGGDERAGAAGGPARLVDLDDDLIPAPSRQGSTEQSGRHRDGRDRRRPRLPDRRGGRRRVAAVARGGFRWCGTGERSGVLYGWWAPLWAPVSAVLGPVTLRVAAVVVLVWALFRRRSAAAAPAVFVAGTILLGGVVPVAVKALVRRQRPEQALVDALDSSFPSAHAFGIATAVLALLAVLAGRVGIRAWRAAALAGAGAVAVICVARVALAVHYVSDVAAGVCLAVVWVVAARPAWRALARRVSASSAAPG